MVPATHPRAVFIEIQRFSVANKLSESLDPSAEPMFAGTQNPFDLLSIFRQEQKAIENAECW